MNGIVAENGKVVTDEMIADWESALERDEWPSGWVNVGEVVEGKLPKAVPETVTLSLKAQTEAYNGMENAYLLANRYIDVMPEVAEAVAKPLTAVDSIKMYGDGNATKLVRDTTGMVDQVTSGLKDATGIDLTELLSSFHQPFQPREDNE